MRLDADHASMKLDLLDTVIYNLLSLSSSTNGNTLTCPRRDDEETFLVLLWVSRRIGQGKLLLVSLSMLSLGDSVLGLLRRRRILAHALDRGFGVTTSQ